MKKLLYASLLLPLLLMSLVACNKDRKYSTWTVNGSETFSTKEVTANVDCNPDNSYCRAVLTSHDEKNWYTIGFALNYFPTNGYYILDTNTISPGVLLCAITFYFHGVFYYHTPSNRDTLYASSIKNKVQYTLPPSWFVNYDNPTGDSIQIEGTFNEP